MYGYFIIACASGPSLRLPWIAFETGLVPELILFESGTHVIFGRIGKGVYQYWHYVLSTEYGNILKHVKALVPQLVQLVQW